MCVYKLIHLCRQVLVGGARGTTTRAADGLRHRAIILAVILTCAIPTIAWGDAVGPTIDAWYGDHQQFGSIGTPQKWINVLGNVSDVDGVASLSFQLNGGSPAPLSIGPDPNRLASPGDFNVEIAIASMLEGSNEILITATDNQDNVSARTVTVDYSSTNVWPLPHNINWSGITDIQQAVQVVDGLWELQGDAIRPAIIGYDRILAVGDRTWTDYQVTVPMTIHGHVNGFGGSGFGIILRWKGHTDWGGRQPTIGWNPIGAGGWYDFGYKGGTLVLNGDNSGRLDEDTTARHLQFDVPYVWKMRVLTLPGVGNEYRLKVWEAVSPEPAEWDLWGIGGFNDLAQGSCLLIAHNADISFGNVAITPTNDISPPLISNVIVTTGATSATITWTTDEAATSAVAFGPTTAYEEGTIESPSLVTSHTIDLAGLQPMTIYHYQIASVDSNGNLAVSAELKFTTDGQSGPGPAVSDDFNDLAINDGVWTFINPLGDATLTLDGFRAVIDLPAGTDHDIWTAGTFAPRLMQSVSDTDFEVDVKFESPLTQKYQMQGVLIEQDGLNLIRAEFHHDGLGTKLFVATFDGGSPTIRANQPVPPGTPIHLRVRRQGHTWSLFYSYNGTTWSNGGSFQRIMTVNAVGVFIGNAGGGGGSVPGFTGIIDYCFNTAAPIVPEDADQCPADPDKSETGPCGCGVPDNDSDNDGIANCADQCPGTVTGSPVDELGCPPVIPGDFDSDGDVDADDAAFFDSCDSGPNITQTDPNCEPAKLDADDDIDQGDFGLLQRCMSGADVPADPACAD